MFEFEASLMPQAYFKGIFISGCTGRCHSLGLVILECSHTPSSQSSDSSPQAGGSISPWPERIVTSDRLFPMLSRCSMENCNCAGWLTWNMRMGVFIVCYDNCWFFYLISLF
jgi:hypothetical protein